MAATSCVRALGSPDIVALLAKHLTRHDLTRLARVSKSCFASTIHLIWSEVRGIHNLLALVPGASCEKDGETGTRKIIIPNLKYSDLTRFDLYAALVVRLYVLPKDQITNYQMSGWEHLQECRKSRVILPSLRVIVSESRSRDETFLRWAMLLLGPTITTLYTHSPQWDWVSLMSMSSTSLLLEQLFEHKVPVEELSFFPINPCIAEPGTDDDDHGGSYDKHGESPFTIPNDDDRHLLGGGLAPSTYSHIKRLTSLRYLATTSFLLDNKSLESLAGLPYLEKILLYCNHTNRDLNLESFCRYPDNPFPSLRSLELVLPDLTCLTRVWSQSALVRSLTEVTIRVQAHVFPGGADIEEYEPGFQSFIPTICEQSPVIERFRMDFDTDEVYPNTPIENAALQSLSNLPLSILDLRYAKPKDMVEACGILGQCKTLRELHLPHHTMLSKDLLVVAQMTNLEYLRTIFDVLDVLQPDRLASATPPGGPNLSLRLLESSVNPLMMQIESVHGFLMYATRAIATQFAGLETVTWTSRPSDREKVCLQMKRPFGDAPGTSTVESNA